MTRARHLPRLLAAGAVAASVVLSAVPAWAHVSVDPEEAPKGGFAKIAFRAPNERDDAGTTQVEVELPADHPIPFVSVKPKPGWTFQVETAQLEEPVEGEGETVTEAVSRITWTGGRIGPGEFDDFELSMGPLPDDTDELVFRALQTYEDGEVVRWIEETPPGGEEPEFPAPVLKLTGSGDGHGSEEPAEEGETESGEGVDVEASGGEEAGEDDSGGTDAVAVVALVVGALGLVAAIAALAQTRRRSP